MSTISDYILTDEAIIVEPGSGTTPTISTLRSENSRTADVRASERAPLNPAQPEDSVSHDGKQGEDAHTAAHVTPSIRPGPAPCTTPSETGTQSTGRQPDISQTSGFIPDAHRRQSDVNQTSIQKSRPNRRQSDVAQTATMGSLSQTSPRDAKPPGRTRWRTGQEESGRYRHTIRIEPKIEDQLRHVAESLGVDMNAAISVCITAQYRLLKRTGNHGT